VLTGVCSAMFGSSSVQKNITTWILVQWFLALHAFFSILPGRNKLAKLKDSISTE